MTFQAQTNRKFSYFYYRFFYGDLKTNIMSKPSEEMWSTINIKQQDNNDNDFFIEDSF